MGLSLNGSVGKGRAQNMSVDVVAVQNALIETCDGESGISRITPSGSTCDPETVAAIISFQKQVLKLPFPDGVVAKGGATHNLLNLGRRWKGGATGGGGVGGVVPPVDGGTPAKSDPVTAGFFAEMGTIAPEIAEAEAAIYRTYIEPVWKGVPGLFSRLEDGRRLYKLYKFLQATGFDFKNLSLVMKQMSRLSPHQFDMIVKGLGTSKSGAKFLAGFAGKLEYFGLVTLFIDIYLYGSKGDWGAAIGECYKMIMNKAVPWAGMIEGLQSLLDAIPMDPVKKTLFFKVLRFCDPVGLGGAAPDALISLARGIMAKDSAEGYRILASAVDRLANGPTGLLKAPAEAIADFVYEVVNGNSAGKFAENMDRRGPKW